jgi:putative endonuclease
MNTKEPCVYIVASSSKKLYIGVTSDLEKRIWEHKNSVYNGFFSKYNCNKLVFFEHQDFMWDAIEREKQLKNWNRKKKLWLIGMSNPKFIDLAEDWY